MAQLIIEGSEARLKQIQNMLKGILSKAFKLKIKSDEDIIDEKLSKGITEGLKGDYVSREKVMKALK